MTKKYKYANSTLDLWASSIFIYVGGITLLLGIFMLATFSVSFLIWENLFTFNLVFFFVRISVLFALAIPIKYLWDNR